MEQSLKAQVKPLTALIPATLSSQTVGEIVDSIGFESMTIIVTAGAVTGACVFKLEHGDQADLSDAADVAAFDLVGDMVALAGDDDNKSKWVGYIGKKRYVRLTFVSGNATVGAVALMGHPYSVPTTE